MAAVPISRPKFSHYPKRLAPPMARSVTLNLEAVRHSGLRDNIVAQLERLIVNDELHVGDALPSERKLAADLQVSRNILREAMGMLAQKGLVEVRSGSGTFVASPTAEFIQDFDRALPSV